MSHTHLNKEDWSCIARMLRSGHSYKEIARTLGKDPSALGRHINKYGGRSGYDALADKGVKIRVSGTLFRPPWQSYCHLSLLNQTF